MKFDEVSKDGKLRRVWKGIEVPPLPDGYSWTIYYNDPAVEGPTLDFPVAWVNAYDDWSDGHEFEMVHSMFLKSNKVQSPESMRMVGTTAEEVINALALKVWTGEYSE